MAITPGFQLGGSVTEDLGKLKRLTLNLRLDGSEGGTFITGLNRIIDVRLSPYLWDVTDAQIEPIDYNSRQVNLLNLEETASGSGKKNKLVFGTYNINDGDEISVTVTGY